MANRFIDTSFYSSPFIRGLKGSLKGLYTYLVCTSTGAGIWTKDLPIASAYIGFKVTEVEFENAFVKTGKLIDLKNGKYFFPDFIEHQYPKGFQANNPAQKKAIEELQKYGLLNENLEPVWKGLSRPFEGSQEEVIVIVKAEEKEKEKEIGGKPKNPAIEEINPHPFSIQFLDHWNRWKEFKWSQHKEKYKAIKTEQTAFNHLVKISQSDETKAIELIDFAISKLWKGIYPDNTQDQKNGKPTYNGKQGAAAAISIIANASRAGNKIDWSSFDTTRGSPGMGGTKKPDNQQNPKG